jgi:hypothetical protein
MTKGETRGVRVYDGMVMAAGSPYYVQIQFAYGVGSGEVTFWQIQAFLASGPH